MAFTYYGAGTSPAGIGPAGADPVGDYSSTAIVDLSGGGVLVSRFDLSTHSIPVDPVTGLIKRVHWVDQAVALALGVTNGKLTSQPSLGNRLRLVQRNNRIRLQAEVNDAVRVALTALIDRGDIVVTDIQISIPVPSQTIVAVFYLNLRLSPTTKLPDNISFVF